MSVTHLGLVLDHLNAKPAVKLIAVILADHADREGVCWPSYRRIAERSGLDQRSVRRHIKTLIELGVVTKLRTGTVVRAGNKTIKVSNAYRVNAHILRRYPCLVASTKLSPDDLLMVDTTDHLQVDTTVHPRGVGLSTKSSVNHQANRQSEKPVDNGHETVALGDVISSWLNEQGPLGQ